MSLRAQLALLLGLVAVTGVLVECVLLSETLSRRMDGLAPERLSLVREALFGLAAGEPLRLLFLRATAWPLLLAAALSLGLAVLASRRFARPLEAVSAAVTRLAAGDLSARPASGVASAEVAVLAQGVFALGEQLAAADAERRYANAAVAHELRTPVGVLRARLAALRDGVLPVTPAELDRLMRHLDGLVRLVDDLETVTRTEAGVLDFRRVPHDLADVVREAALDAGLGPRLDLVTQPGLMICGDALRLHQAVGNVLDNARRFTPPGGTVRVQVARCSPDQVWMSPEHASVCAEMTDTSQGRKALSHPSKPERVQRMGDPGWARVTIGDSGPGVAKEDWPRLFDRYFRSDASRARDTGGSGLGLTVAAAVVGAHGGRVEAGVSPLGGLEVRLWFPLLDSPLPAQP